MKASQQVAERGPFEASRQLHRPRRYQPRRRRANFPIGAFFSVTNRSDARPSSSRATAR
jgi:hypothetical protein